MSLRRPGFGLPLDHLPQWTPPGRQAKTEDTRFPHAIADFFATSGVSLREQRMLAFINQITDKPRWWEKIGDEAIVAKWREEACGSEDEQRTSARHLDETSFEYCMNELRDKSAYMAKHGVIHVLDTNATIVKLDLPIEDTFWISLKAAAFSLEDVPAWLKDWHPWTGESVLDLLHPSLFPLQYGKSRVLPDGVVPLDRCSEYIGMGETCPVPAVLGGDEGYTKNISWHNDSTAVKAWGSYQWLPSEVSIDQEGIPHIDSYVNNLHPKEHPGLYKALETAVDKAIPMWNECLSWFHERLRIVHKGELGYHCYEAPTYPGYIEENPEEDESERNWAREEHYRDWLENNPTERRLVQPSADKFVPFDVRAEDAGVHRIDLRSEFPDGLQVIFKLANIHLTPENPRYEGSNWHVEGCLNEHIAATALFYYDSDNITDNFLEFRQHVDSEKVVMMPMQGEYVVMHDMYGLGDSESAVQDLGQVLTRPGRLLAFPNVLQHKVRDFELEDPSKPGHRKILAMFLIDPHIKILSTANVPPQRRDWWAVEVRKIRKFKALPQELFDRIISFVEEFPISWDTACEARERLMEERGTVTDTYNDMLNNDTFFFCEH